QSWKPVYKQCDFVLDTTNGRTYDFMQRIEDELVASGVQFKARRQPNDTDNRDGKEPSQELQFNNSLRNKLDHPSLSKTQRFNKRISNDTETKQIVLKKEPSNKVVSYKAGNDKRRKHKKSNQAVTGHKTETISKQRTPQGGNGYEKNRNTNKRRRRTWNERRHKSSN
ncbi:MAG: hypothetical protein E6444_10345, partial [Streptococcus parasanguinis]|nr:hypothetical protein [Streptococcus parasanguinis]